MRRSNAPSMKRSSAPCTRKQPVVVSSSVVTPSSDTGSYFPSSRKLINEQVSSSTSNHTETAKENQPDTAQGSQIRGTIAFNVVWRDISAKKHKTWKGDGTLELSANGSSVVLKDSHGKYMGSSSNFTRSELKDGLQLLIGGKEIELLDEIKDPLVQCRFAAAQRGWDAEIEKEEQVQPKGQFVFRPNLVLPVLKYGAPKERELKHKLPKVTSSACKVAAEVLILKTPEDTAENKYNKWDRPVHEVRVLDSLVDQLRPHQREGVRFLYDCLMGFRLPNYHGAILADEMGLGKTLQCLAVASTMLRTGPFGGERVLKRVLIVTPSSLTGSWSEEICKWLRAERMYAFVIDANHKLEQYSRQQHLPFVIVSYEMLLARAMDFQQIEFDLLICDEGHRLKNNTTKVYNCLRDLNIMRRVLLTGTPLQNNLQEFYMLADFVNPGVFGSYAEFRKEYEQPIVRAQEPDANEQQLQEAAKCSVSLQRVSEKFLLRRTQELNRKYLPKKLELVIFVRPSELQQLLLTKALEFYKHRMDSILQHLKPLEIITILRKICNHPSLVARTKTPNLFTRNLERYLPDWSEMGPFDSAKLELVQQLLTSAVQQSNEKIVLVSNHTKTLDILQGLCDYMGLLSLRLDGDTPVADRQRLVNKFNEPVFPECEMVFLLSAKAGGLGLNLCGAKRLVMFDSDWNPATDAQAMSRIWRDGQQHAVQIYRLITSGTIEEKIFQRQIAKTSLGDCLLQSSTVSASEGMKFSAEDLLDLFSLPTDVASCQTHDSLNCPCGGDGQNANSSSIRGQINELMLWEHHAPPWRTQLLQTVCLENSAEDIQFIFAKQTNIA